MSWLSAHWGTRNHSAINPTDRRSKTVVRKAQSNTKITNDQVSVVLVSSNKVLRQLAKDWNVAFGTLKNIKYNAARGR